MKRSLRSVCMVVAIALGAVFHGVLGECNAYLPYGVGAMLFITFMGVHVEEMKPRGLHFWILAAIPLLALAYWLVARASGFPVLAESLFYCAAAPIAVASPVIVQLLRGNVEFSTTAMLLSHASFALTMPLLLPLLLEAPDLTYAELAVLVAKQLGAVLLLPSLLAFAVRWMYPPSRAWASKLADVSLGLWCVNLAVISAWGTQHLMESGVGLQALVPLGLGALAVCAVGFVVGYRMGYPSLKRECSQALGQKNTILVLYIAAQSYSHPLAYVGPVFYIFFHNFANSVQIFLASREKKR